MIGSFQPLFGDFRRGANGTPLLLSIPARFGTRSTATLAHPVEMAVFCACLSYLQVSSGFRKMVFALCAAPYNLGWRREGCSQHCPCGRGRCPTGATFSLRPRTSVDPRELPNSHCECLRIRCKPESSALGLYLWKDGERQQNIGALVERRWGESYPPPKPC